jgi:hypothetical protein
VQALLQQTPSAQLPVAQVEPAVHGWAWASRQPPLPLQVMVPPESQVGVLPRSGWPMGMGLQEPAWPVTLHA